MKAVHSISEHGRSPGLLKLLEFYNLKCIYMVNTSACTAMFKKKKIFLAETSRVKEMFQALAK